MKRTGSRHGAVPNGAMLRLLAITERMASGLSAIGAALAMIIVIYMLGHIILEIAMRLVGRSTFILDEYIGYAVSAMTFLGLPYALQQGGLIRVSLVLEKLPQLFRWPLELFSSLVALVTFAWLAKYMTLAVQRSYERDVVSESMAQTPLWLPQLALLIGLYLLCLVLVVRTVRILVQRHLFVAEGR